jgi:parvulin-like peptidyl-prolyl isomerase
MDDYSDMDVEPEEIVNFLKQEINLKEICQKILFQKAIAQIAQQKGIVVTTDEIQAEANCDRRERSLEKAADTVAWLTEQMIAPSDWELGIRNRLLAQKVAEAMFGNEVGKFFIQNRSDFDQIILYQMIVANEKLAQELYYQIEEGETSFYAAANLYDIDENRRRKCGYEGKIYRWALDSDIAAIAFSASAKELIGPIKTKFGYHLLLVEELIPAELTPQRYQEILNHMFKQWLNLGSRGVGE